MKNQLIEFETAKLAKEKGFSVGTNGCFVHYKEENKHPEDGTSGPFGWEKDELQYDSSYIVNGRRNLGDISNEHYECFERPTQQALEDWMFNEHNIVIGLLFDDMRWNIYVGEFTTPDDSTECVDYIECEGFKEAKKNRTIAREKALIYVLKLIKTKNK